MLNNLESTIQTIIVQSAAAMARQIVNSVRQSLAAELMGSATAVAAPALAAPKRRGRPPGSKSKVAPAAPAAAPAAPAVKAARKGKRSRRGISQAELEVVLSALQKKPGLTSVQIQKAAGIDAKQAARVLTKLRKTKKVQLKGKRSGATYTVA